MDYYKKKYDEALERARKLKENPQSVFNEYSPKEGDTICDYIFPELKESEDERIRKELIEHVKDQQSSFISAPDCRDKYEEEENNKYNSWIAWLEKQGKQMSDPRYSILDKLIEADDIYQMSVNDAMVEEAKNKAIEALSKLEISKLLGLEKQGEQKPTIEMISAEESLGIDSETYKKIVDECIYGDDKQKLAWGEEDEVCLNTTIAYLKDAQEFKKTAENCIDWLKKLKQRIGDKL